MKSIFLINDLVSKVNNIYNNIVEEFNNIENIIIKTIFSYDENGTMNLKDLVVAVIYCFLVFIKEILR